jgi:hypothetical protein
MTAGLLARRAIGVKARSLGRVAAGCLAADESRRCTCRLRRAGRRGAGGPQLPKRLRLKQEPPKGQGTLHDQADKRSQFTHNRLI